MAGEGFSDGASTDPLILAGVTLSNFRLVIDDGGTFMDGIWTAVGVPEPASLAMIGLVSGLGLFIRRRFLI